ncbi:hypothetical protein ACWHLZ_01725 [Streptomyces chartreusis]|uniref:hypothetical protein n=1 Tax=Streptomyces chartreusis TaxID=1969 RepID=UPI002E823C08|nr:hypothetical protein [Streptomyces chartreusis]WUB15333.1 hypothetical protein OG997_00900 [Streptomyces chartreusis]
MPESPRPDGQVSPALDQVNRLIRRLMGKPASRTRTAEYERLLVRWAEVFKDDAPPDDVEPAA